MTITETPYVRIQREWSEWIEKKIGDLKVQRSIARASERSGGPGHLRNNGRTVSSAELSIEIKMWEHMLNHCHDDDDCGVYQPQQLMVSTELAARIAGVSIATARKRVSEGQWDGEKVGRGAWRVRLDERIVA